MRKVSLIFIIAIFLSSCAPATVVPTATATITLTKTPTITPSPTPTLTSTPHPTVTPTPMLPTSVEIELNQAVPENVNKLVEKTVTQAYWFYVNLGCSPNGFRVKITKEESGEVIAIDAFKVGWEDLETDPSVMAQRVSHETAHIMCQFSFTKRLNMGLIDMRWLTEGVPNYFAALEQLTNTGMNSGWQGNIIDQEVGQAEWVSQNFCDIPLSSLEPANADRILQEFAGVGDVATRLLVKTNLNGFQAITNYYTLLATNQNKVAFQQAFGMTKEEFYQLYKDECSKGFPTIISNPSQ